MTRLKALLFACACFSAGVALMANAPTKAPAANLPLISGPYDSGNALGVLNSLVQSINSGVGGLVNAQTAAVATGTGTAEQVLQTYTLPANTLTAAGQAVRATCWGATGATANNKTIKLYFGASVITTPTYAGNAQTWYLDIVAMRTAAATQAVFGRGVAGTASITPVAVYANAGTDDLTAGVVIKCTGTDGTSAAADITANGMITELIK